MIRHEEVSDQQLRQLIKSGGIQIAGNVRLKIYGRLSCKSGKKMRRENRVFFHSTQAATQQQFRPCGHCMKKEYETWKRKTA
jgi:methylphosphotriester-DNA--protein-cysteine methyltransferase